MINVVPTEAKHLYMFKPKGCFSGDSVDYVIPAIENHPACTMMVDDRPVAIFGFIKVYDRTGELWGHVSEGMGEFPIASARAAKELLETFASTYKLRRLQMVVKKDYLEGYKFSLFLGFTPEGIMREYGPEGSDYYMMGRIF